MELSKVKTRYDIDPLKEIYYKLKEKNDMYFAVAMRNNISLMFFQFLKRQLIRNENIIINCSGRTRSSKSTSIIIIAQWIYMACNELGIHNRKFDVGKNIMFGTSEFISKFKDDKLNMHDVYIIDEKKLYEAIQSGALYEEGQLKDIDRITAKLCIHRFNIVGSYDDIDNNAFYSLVTYGKDYKNYKNKLLVYTREDNERVPLGYIELPVSSFLCKDITTNKVTDCIVCPLYSKENHNKYIDAKNYNKDLKLCKLQKATYERLKDKNIEKTSLGGIEERTKVKIELTNKFVTDPDYVILKSKIHKKVYIQDNYHRYTNRRLTIEEIDEILNRSDIIRSKIAPKNTGLGRFIK